MKRLIGKVCVFVTGLTVFMGAFPVSGLYADAASASELSISQNGIDFICEKEGFSATCYYDSSQSSIGYGTRCGDYAHSSGQHSITEEEASAEMEKAINNYCIPNVRRQTDGIDMNQNQFDALVSFTYNTGGGTSMIKNSPLVKYLQGTMTEDEARSAYANYIVTSGGRVLTGLINRRKSEADLFFSDTDSVSDDSSYESTDTEKISLGKYKVATKDDPLSMRKAPTTSSDILAYIPKGTTLEVYEISEGWANVSWNGSEGYCSMAYLKSADENITSQYVVATKNDPLSMRQAPDTSSSILTCIPRGTTVEVSEINNGWAKVSWNGSEGYCSMAYLKSADEETVSEYIIATKDDPLNMRKSPDTSSSILTRIPKGTTVEVSEINNGWANVSWNGFEGYCSMTYLEKAE